MAFLMTQTSLTNQAWRSASARILAEPAAASANTPVHFSLAVPGMDLNQATVVWEAAGQEPHAGATWTLPAETASATWVEAEASWPDGRRAFATKEINAGEQ